MSDKKPEPTPDEIAARVCAAAQRAAAEAQARREKARAAALAPEEGGPRGLEPTRYGDWEQKGIATDF